MNLLRLIPEAGGAFIEIDQDRVRIGRDPGSDVHLADVSISRRHAEILKRDGDWIIVDLESSNGTVIDGVRVAEGLLLPGQRLQLGSVGFQVTIDHGDGDPTVIFGRSPVAGRHARPAPAHRPTPWTWILITVGLAGGLVFISTALAIVLYLASARRPAPLPVRAEAAAEVPRSTPAPTPTVTPFPPTEVSAARVPASPRGLLVISTDTRAEVWVDGRRTAVIPAGGSRRAPVSPGEHTVTFRVGNTRQDRVVHALAGEQVRARYSKHDPPAAVERMPVTKATPLPLRALAPNQPEATPVSSPVPAPVASTSTPLPALPVSPQAVPVPSPALRVDPSPQESRRAADEGLLKGAAENARGDFYRAILTLKDVARRLETDPRAARDLALTQAHLAWTYHGLNRDEDARAAVESALRADPNVVVNTRTFPESVVLLFDRVRRDRDEPVSNLE